MAHALPRRWERDGFLITTDMSDFPLSRFNDLFAQPDFSWARPLDDEQLQAMVRGSLCFAILEKADAAAAKMSPGLDPRLIGLGRWVTDNVTVVYINDIYVVKEHRGKGLARWLLECMNEQLALIPSLRGTIMIAERGSTAERLYKRYFFMEDLVATDILLDRKGPGSQSLETREEPSSAPNTRD